MRAKWRSQHLPQTAAYVLALLFGGPVGVPKVNPNQPGDLEQFEPEDLRLVIDEGRRQLADQAVSFRHVTDRGQVLTTVSLAVLAFWAASGRSFSDDTWTATLGQVLWAGGGVLAIIGVAASASVVVVQATFTAVDTTEITTWEPPVLRRLAADYAGAVVNGENTVASRVTLFRQATRIVVWASVLVASSVALALVTQG